MNKILMILKIAFSILKMTGSFIGTWLTLGWKTRKARKSFEAELRKQGMSKHDAQSISKFISELKDQFTIRNLIKTFNSIRRESKSK